MQRLPCQREERLFDALVHFRGGLHEFDAELVGKLAALLLGHGALVRPVGLVSNEDLVDALRCMLLDIRVPGPDVFDRSKQASEGRLRR